MPAVFLPNIQYIYFDFDNVLVKRAENRAALVAQMLGLPDPSALREFYFVEFHRDPELERRYLHLQTVAEEITFYRDLFGQFAEGQGVKVSAGQLQATAEAFVRVQQVVQPGVIDGLEKLSERYVLGILSNGLPSRHQEIAGSGIEQYFKNTVISSDYNIEKPALELYRRAEEVAEFPAADIALVDDEPANIAAAEQVGFGQAVLFTPGFWQQVQQSAM